jgi:transposase-like protein
LRVKQTYMEGQERKAALLLQFANRQESSAEFAKQHGVRVGTLYRWQSEQRGFGFVEIKPDVRSIDEVGSRQIQKGDLRIEFVVLPELGYLQSILKTLV